MSGDFNWSSSEPIWFLIKLFFSERYNIELIILKLHENDTRVWSLIDCCGIFYDLSLVLMNLDFINLIK